MFNGFGEIGIFFSIVPLFFIILIVLSIISTIRNKSKNNPDKDNLNYTIVNETTNASHIRYKNESGRKPNLFSIIYLIVFAIIWFGILAGIISSMSQMGESGFFFVFIIPFVLAGGLVVLKAVFDIKAFVKSKNETQNTEQTHLKTDENYYLKLCKHCGKELKPNDYFCSECGNKVE